ncbi:MAG: hypothetical protein ABI760_19170 [Ferruginibacter sp.]
MKKQSFVLFSSMNKEDITNLAMGIKETIAFGLVEFRPKKFTAAELWNIQRQGKARIQRRYL